MNEMTFLNSQVSIIRFQTIISILIFVLFLELVIIYFNLINNIFYKKIIKFIYICFISVLFISLNFMYSKQLCDSYNFTKQTFYNKEELKMYDKIIIKPKSFLDVLLYGKDGFDIEYIENTEDIIVIDTYQIINNLENQYIKLSDGTELFLIKSINKDYIKSLENKECIIHYIKNKENGNTKVISIEKNILVKDNYNVSR